MPHVSRAFTRFGVALVASFAGCASYEQVPNATDAMKEPACSSACSGSASGGKNAAAGSAGRSSSGAANGNGSGGQSAQVGGSSGDGGNAASDAGHAGVFVGGVGGGTAGGASPLGGTGQAGDVGAAGAAAGTAAGGGASGGFPLSWTFAQGTEGWAVRDQSPELAVVLTAAAGAAQLNDVPLSQVKQFVDVAYTFASPVDLRGRTLHATLQRTAGEFVGVQLYVYGGSWQSPGFESLSSGAVTVLTAAVDSLSGSGFTPASVARIGLKLGTGSNAANVFAKTSVQITEVTID